MIIELCQKYLDLGFTFFKVKVGRDLKDDIRRLELVRNTIGWDKILVSKTPIKKHIFIIFPRQ